MQTAVSYWLMQRDFLLFIFSPALWILHFSAHGLVSIGSWNSASMKHLRLDSTWVLGPQGALQPKDSLKSLQELSEYFSSILSFKVQECWTTLSSTCLLVQTPHWQGHPLTSAVSHSLCGSVGCCNSIKRYSTSYSVPPKVRAMESQNH